MTIQAIKTPTDIREESEDIGRNDAANPTMGDIINKRFSRRGFLQGTLAIAAIATTVSPLAILMADEARAVETELVQNVPFASDIDTET